ncbi:proton-conducting transporter transmembrane domain-containing protein [Roseimaritima ulvae]|uniref:NAD(P)H-quinone oxidoreductase chain 4 1 n=1 Tax=Roseimaritima ulvae TaxID=980254 RepID=A0A5B9QZQ4_9BACT|nr:proton-conducting transporter membrane subunit [Roseimaritima ulvae]QEG43582.1 NAD(P)H-quinone oxidoreductase chain 4 1 [Roseimaritima ulvae]
MPELHFPWIEVSILVPLFGALWLQIIGNHQHALRYAIGICSLTFLLTVGELLDFVSLGSFEAHDHWLFLDWLFNRDIFVVDELSAFQLPLAALIFLVTVMSTLRTKAPRFSLRLTLISETLVLATFSCRTSWTLIALLIASAVPPYLELRRRQRCTRIYVLHMSAFAVLLLVGYGWLAMVDVTSTAALVPGALLTVAALLRSGIFPLHLWITAMFEKNTFGTAILFTTPLVGAYAVMRLVLPIAPSWALQSIAVLSLVTAVYAGGMALIQREARRMFCFLLLSQSSLVLVGLELVTPIGLTGALCLWLSVGLSLTGFGITLRCIESRISRVSLADFHGLSKQMPMLAGFFLLTGLAAIGFPATIGFVGMELLIEGAVDVYPLVGTMVVIAAALCGIAVLLAYFRIFTGHTNNTLVPMHARPAERMAVLVLTVLIVGGGLVPQPGVASRYHAAKELTRLRQSNPITQHQEVEKPPPETQPQQTPDS